MSHVDTANMSQCHYALQIPDILDIVFENMAPVWNEADRATCASCARVCKSFQQPATRALWSELRDLWPLWKILHPISHTWTKLAENDPYFARLLKEKPYLDPVLWERFLRCAARVRGIHTSYGFASNQARFCCALIRHNHDKTFLPSLQRLSWAQDRKCGPHLLALLAPPTLHTLWFRYRYGSNADSGDSNIDSDFFAKPDEGQVRATENVLSSMASRCLSLHSLYICHSFISTSSLLPELLRFRKLRNLDCSISCWPSSILYTHSDLRALTQTLHLRELAVNIGEFHVGQTSCNVIDCPDLQDLSCTGMSADVARLAACLWAPVLTVFRAVILDDDTMQPSDFLDFFLAVSTHSSNSLRVLSFSQCGATSDVHPALSVVGSISFSDALPSGPWLSNIEDLRLQFTLGAFLLSFTDEDALVLARAMPRIRYLTLNCFRVESRVPSPLALHHFAKHCPRLRVLHLNALEGSPIPVSYLPPRPPLRWKSYTCGVRSPR